MPRLLPFQITVAVLALVFVGALVGTDRGLILSDRPMVAHIAAITPPGDFDLAEVLDDYGVHLVHPPGNVERYMLGQQTGDALARKSYGKTSAPAAGRSIRELAFLCMPFGWFADSDFASGDVVYIRNDVETVYSELNARGREALTRANGGDVFQRGIFPFWAHAWGWLWVLGVGLAIWFWLRAQAKRREAEGII
jgi:hypothetical protein